MDNRRTDTIKARKLNWESIQVGKISNEHTNVFASYLNDDFVNFLLRSGPVFIDFKVDCRSS